MKKLVIKLAAIVSFLFANLCFAQQENINHKYSVVFDTVSAYSYQPLQNIEFQFSTPIDESGLQTRFVSLGLGGSYHAESEKIDKNISLLLGSKLHLSSGDLILSLNNLIGLSASRDEHQPNYSAVLNSYTGYKINLLSDYFLETRIGVRYSYRINPSEKSPQRPLEAYLGVSFQM